ncbi:cytochrome ubiquinol oxidase subunit I [Moorella sp. E308F]|uniref:cytochrome ubiquinol oxidase subunit I n=1 Tax=unclassified Neomoorella TaxID=2676739 RepID=UPI0010FFBD1C|nr:MULTISPECIES: cytochrome ubiquinol oxidase subunit I [unclassified Moorella (in: firmicutes)]GEA14049.1 cytochrome ubiquinol oxidase subunit I [Moorella sp. E308F]GEA18575.1 cytochrome ubiquinol oxidase subunit I [Moorella sp. E306M]
MDALLLARWQFGITSVYHFLFVPLTLGLSVLVAIMETIYVRTGDETYKNMARFWGRLFLINFAMGVVTGIVQEFHFGMNWSEYSRFVGDIFGAPLAVEALAAFFLESTFLGLWLFGWDKLPKALHAACIWLVAFGTNLSAFWILVANSFMQEPVGYVLRNGRAEMTDFFALLTNTHVLYQFPHTVLAGFVTASFFVMGISAYHLLRQSQLDPFRRSFRLALITGVISSLLVAAVGHFQGQYLVNAQPMKMAAAEALWESADPAPLALVALVDTKDQTNTFEIKIPALASFLAYNSFQGEVKGLKDLQAAAEASYGPGNYIPPVAPVFWSFRLMVVAGLWLILLSLYSLYLWRRRRLEEKPLVLKALLWSIPVPYLANTAGWLMAEIGRYPWIVYGLQRVEAAVSPGVSAAAILTTLVAFTLLYGVLAVADVYLLAKYARQGVETTPATRMLDNSGEVSLWI